ncbi:MAG TPA: hypothetical protein PKA60_02445 [Candidatus Paceibacterota bacterium]|nr:hypothetical protein [Candidatus Paceibacterota bacterium]
MQILNLQKNKNSILKKKHPAPSILGYGPQGDWVLMFFVFAILLATTGFFGYVFYQKSIIVGDYSIDTKSVNKGILDMEVVDKKTTEAKIRTNLFYSKLNN